MPGGKSGNGWVTCEQGHQHWGLFGAAGVLVYVAHPTDQALSLVLLQRRARWSHQGGTWALPGGAMDSDETPAEAALREADEECMLDPKLVVPRGMYSAEHGGWTYHTVLAQAAEPLRVYSDAYESDEAVWLPAGEVDQLDLHPGFAASWPVLREALLPLTVFVDGTGITGTEPAPADQAGEGRRLYARLTGLTRSGLWPRCPAASPSRRSPAGTRTTSWHWERRPPPARRARPPPKPPGRRARRHDSAGTRRWRCGRPRSGSSRSRTAPGPATCSRT